MNRIAERLSRHSYLEATARDRVAALLDTGSFDEFLAPPERVISPHLPILGVPAAFDDGLIAGQGRLDGQKVLIAAQEGSFMGGAVGEVHGAKLTGILECAVEQKPASVLLLFDTGGVRLHEANVGLVAMAEIQRSVFEARHAGVTTVALIGGANGCYGGTSIIASCCDHIVMSEEGRLSISGPEVIETAHGIEEFDSQDRALVWRTMGGKHRYLMEDADVLVEDDIAAFRKAAINLLGVSKPLEIETLISEQARLGARLEQHGKLDDATDIWRALGVPHPEDVPSVESSELVEWVSGREERPA